MPEQTGRFAWTCKLARIGLFSSLALLLLILAAVSVQTVVIAMSSPNPEALVPLILAILYLLVAGVWIVVAYGVVKILAANEFGVSGAGARLVRIETLLESQTESTRKLAELAALSDRAKSLIFREREIEAIRETLHEDLIRQDYKTAETLIDAIETKLGYADEAARLRTEVEASRKATLEEKIDAAVGRIQGILDRHDWARALRESRRLIRLFPDNPKISSLPERIGVARTQRKRGLLQAYGEAVRKNDVDQSIQLLKELDLYLTPQEAAALQESARGVFRARLRQLGVQFAIRVTDEHWSQAIAAGDDIIREYPNSRMAQEVREKMEMLRARAAMAGAS